MKKRLISAFLVALLIFVAVSSLVFAEGRANKAKASQTIQSGSDENKPTARSSGGDDQKAGAYGTSLVAAESHPTAAKVSRPAQSSSDEDSRFEGTRSSIKNDDNEGDDDEEEDSSNSIIGLVQAYSAQSITVNDQTLTVNSSTEKEGKIAVGAYVKVEFKDRAGVLTATEIEVKRNSAAVPAATAAPAPRPIPAPAPATVPAPRPTPTPAPAPTNPPAALVSFSRTIQPMFNSACNTCHPAGGVSLSTYSQIKARAGNLGMGSSRLTASQKATLATWVSQGAPNN